MNLLMVDDSLDILEGVRAGVDFKTLGFDHVYYAQNIFQAKDVLNSIQIDIMIADIEMPHGSGLELLQWVRDNKLDIVTMFCTGFANFDYARKAIELQSFDYYLKPISYSELTGCIARAVEEVRRSNSIKNLKNNRDQFWSEFLYGNIRPDEAEIRKSTAIYNVDYKPGDRFSLLVVSMDDRDAIPVSSNKIAPVLRNIAEECFNTEQMALESILFIEDIVWILVLKQKARPYDNIAFCNACKFLIGECNSNFNSDTNCYYTDDCRLDAVPGRFGNLVEVCRDDVSGINAIISIKDYHLKELKYHLDVLDEWEELLTHAKKDELVHKIFLWIDNRVLHNQMNQKVLNYFIADVMQMVYTVLKDRQIEAHKLFENEKFELIRKKSLRSVEAMKRFAGHLIETACGYLQLVDQSQTVIDKVTDYIGGHLDEDITRESIGKIVFLNSDYLSRLFKKETGKSLCEYLLDKRMEKAKELLVKSDLPINMVALEVGYGNFAYFTKMFHKEAGVTPTEYRAEYRKHIQT